LVTAPDVIMSEARGWILITFLAITAGVISHGLIAWAQQRVDVGTISIIQLSQPGFGVLWAATFLSESVEPNQLVGMAIVLGAVGTIAWRSAQKTPGKRQPSVPKPQLCDT
jgi:drug/metabolite transporter (DMT)-like permease